VRSGRFQSRMSTSNSSWRIAFTLILPDSGISVKRVCLFHQCHPALPLSRESDPATESDQDLGLIGGKRHRLGFMLEQIELLGRQCRS